MTDKDKNSLDDIALYQPPHNLGAPGKLQQTFYYAVASVLTFVFLGMPIKGCINQVAAPPQDSGHEQTIDGTQPPALPKPRLANDSDMYPRK